MTQFIQNFQKYNFPNFGWTRLPEPPITVEDKKKFDAEESISNIDFLEKLCLHGLERKNKEGLIPIDKFNIYKEQLKLELSVFEELHFTKYMLLVWKVVDKAREYGIFIDFGRGSIGSSIVSWFLNITGCDPIKYNLIFSRFVSKFRSKSKLTNNEIWTSLELAPDADINLGEGRNKIINWLNEVYPNRIAKIANVSTFTGKALIKDVYKSLEEATEEEAKYISDLIERRFGIVKDLEEVYQENEEFKNWADRHIKTYQTSLLLRDLIRQYSSHASGYLISYEPIIENTPLMLSSDKEIMSCYTMTDVQSLKLDLLSLTTNKIINSILNQIPEKIDNLNLDDNPEIYNHLQDGKFLPYGLYQISADCAYRVTNDIKPKNILELSDVNAIARPGALAYLKGYVSNDEKSPHMLFEKVLKRTRNYCLYQEQMMALLILIGFTADESEVCRKIVGKKLIEKVKEWKQKIYDKVKENNLPENIGDVLWKVLDDSSKYSFNFSHALSTSYLTALTVYLKYKYPLQFYTACLNSAGDLSNPLDEIALISKELSYFNIKLLPPNIKNSEDGFYIEGSNIRFGLKMIKGVSDKNIEKLKMFCTTHSSNKFEVFESLKNCGINLGIGSALIQAGCLDGITNQSRSRVVLELQTWNILTDKEKILCKQVADKNNYDVLNCILYLKNHKDENDKNYIKETRFETIKKKYQKYKEIYQLNSKNEKLANYYYEKTILGYSYSSTLKEIYDEFTDGLIPLNEIKTEASGIKVKGVGFVVDKPYKGKSKKGTKYMALKIADESGEIRAKIFSDKLDNCEKMNDGLPEEDSLIIFEGTKMDAEMVFLDKIGLQHQKIFMKLSDLAKEE